MTAREIRPSTGYLRDYKQLIKKHRELERALKNQLDEIASSQRPSGDQIPGLSGAPVFKVRIAFGNRGKSHGARLIYYVDETVVAPLFLYAKGDRSGVPAREIVDALTEASLLPEPPSDPTVRV